MKAGEVVTSRDLEHARMRQGTAAIGAATLS